jgi:hypothetical protein
MTELADAFIDAADSAADLLDRAAVADQWDQPSALAEFTVRGLAGHLASQILGARAVLDSHLGPEVAVVALRDHYDKVLWRGADVNEQINVDIRASGERWAEQGQAALLAAVRTAIDELRTLLSTADGGRPVPVPAGWALSLDDYLTTRMMEIAVHNDDLAVSVGITAPELPERVIAPVCGLLLSLSLRRHGQAAVLRALSRAERAPESIAGI